LCLVDFFFNFIFADSIAFKPAESGWGATSKYSRNFDQIFAKKDKHGNGDKDEKKKDRSNYVKEMNPNDGIVTKANEHLLTKQDL
jgi:hypothetical protein